MHGRTPTPQGPSPGLRRRAVLVAALAAALGAGSMLAVGAHADPQPSARSAPSGDSAQPVADREAIATARQLGDAIASVAEGVSPSVVSIRVEARRPAPRMGGLPFPFFGMPGMPQQGPDEQIQQGNGSGVIIRSDGHILTNNHVVEHATRMTVVLKDGRHLQGELVGADPATDLAVLKVDASGLSAAPFANSDRVRPGQWSVAIGSPFGLDYTVTAGVVSAVGRAGFGAAEIEDFIQTDAAINPGNSGGPLVDLDGRVLGVNTMIVGRGSGIGFAVPSNLARQVANQIIDEGQVRRAWIGVSFQPLTPELASHFGLSDGTPRGALVSGVVPDGPAAKAGVRAGDVVLQVDGEPIADSHDLLRSVLRKSVGSKVALQVLRDGRARNLTVTAGERPGSDRDAKAAASSKGNGGADPAAGFGLRLRPLTPELAKRLQAPELKHGVVVAGVAPGAPAARAGLRQGDIIVEADRQPVRNVEHLQKALSDGKAVLRVQRGDGSYYTVLQKDG
jgi:serine protease Do